MEQVNVTQAAQQLSDLLNRVASQGASFELTRGGRRIARLVPSGPPERMSLLIDTRVLIRVERSADG